MAEDNVPGAAIIRTSFFDKVIKQVTVRAYKFKQALTIDNTKAWKNFFYREKQGALAPPTGTNIRAIPRGAEFPQTSVNWDQIRANIEKYGHQENIDWEDIISNDIDVQTRTLVKIAESVVKAVDDGIWLTLSQEGTISTGMIIQAIDYSAANNASRRWNEASASILDDLMRGKELMGNFDYETQKTMCFVNQKGWRAIVNYVADKGAQWPMLAAKSLTNGSVGQIAGIDFVVSRSVEASSALLVIPKRVGTWKQLAPLTTQTETKKGKNVLIWTYEMGVTQLTDPKAAVVYLDIFRSGIA